MLGCTHAEVGGYLLGIWGLTNSVVEAVLWHHRPWDSPVAQPSPLAAVHIANCVYASLDRYLPYDVIEMDHSFLARCGFGDKEEELAELCRNIFAKETARFSPAVQGPLRMSYAPNPGD